MTFRRPRYNRTATTERARMVEQIKAHYTAVARIEVLTRKRELAMDWLRHAADEDKPEVRAAIAKHSREAATLGFQVAEMESLLARLDESETELLYWRYVKELSYGEIAARLQAQVPADLDDIIVYHKSSILRETDRIIDRLIYFESVMQFA